MDDLKHTLPRLAEIAGKLKDSGYMGAFLDKAVKEGRAFAAWAYILHMEGVGNKNYDPAEPTPLCIEANTHASVGIGLHKNGEIFTKCHYKNGIPNGRCQRWYSNRKRLCNNTYKNGLLHGESITWRGNGDRMVESIYRYGLRHGTATVYGKWGGIWFVSEYRKGIEHGECTIFSQNGVLSERTHFKCGKRNGLSIIFDGGGVKKSEYVYKNNILDGIAKHFDKDGNVTKTMTYERGVLKCEIFSNGHAYCTCVMRNEK